MTTTSSLPVRVTEGTYPETVLTIVDDDGPPGAPQSLRATSGDGFVTLAWGPPPPNDSPLERYEVRVDGAGAWRERPRCCNPGIARRRALRGRSQGLN